MKIATLVTLIFLILVVPVFAGESIIFTGVPEVKISEGGISRLPANLTRDEAIKYKCIITQLDERYYWTSRENVELVPISSGAYITYLAVNGSGYVRVINSEMKELIREGSSIVGDPEGTFDYVEHLLLGLKSVTYYGNEK